MSVLTKCIRSLTIKPVLPRNMDRTVKILRLEEKLEKTEMTVMNLLQEIEKMKAELATLKTQHYLEPSAIQKRKFSTSPVSSHIEDYNTGHTNKKTKLEFDRNGDYVIVYTDGACSSNGKVGSKAGIGVWFGESHPLNIAKRCPGRQTNNTAEILACAEACRIAFENGIDKLQINTDSKFVIDCVTKWMPNWKRNGWKTASGKPVVNKDDLINLEKYSAVMKDVKFKHVSGHVGIVGNEGADKLAVAGANM